EPAERALSAAEVNSRKPLITIAFVLKPAGLIFVAARDLPFVVEPLTLHQCGVVQATVRFKHNPKLTLLVRVSPKAKLIRAEHQSFPILAFDVQVKLQRENRAGIACVSRHAITIQQANIYTPFKTKQNSNRRFLRYLKKAVPSPFNLWEARSMLAQSRSPSKPIVTRTARQERRGHFAPQLRILQNLK